MKRLLLLVLAASAAFAQAPLPAGGIVPSSANLPATVVQTNQVNTYDASLQSMQNLTVTTALNASAAVLLANWTGVKSSTTFPAGDGTMQTISSAFSAITGATNTGAAMVVGTGATLGVSGSGTITATASPVTAGQVVYSGTSSAFTGNSGFLFDTTNNVTVPAGSAGHPGINFAGVTTTGFNAANSTTIFIDHGGATTGQLNSTQWVSPGAIAIGCNSSSCVEVTRTNQTMNLFKGDGSTGATFNTSLYATDTNCASAASPAVCAASSAGRAVIAAAATTVVINTTAVTAASEIRVDEDASLGTALSVTCNTQSSLVLGTPRVTARSAGASFTVSIDVGPTTNPMCLSYSIIN